MKDKGLQIVGGGKNVGNEELRQWLENYIKDHPHLTTERLSKDNQTGISKTALDAYLNGTYFLPKPQGSGVNPANSNLEKKLSDFRDKVDGVGIGGYAKAFIETRSWQQFQYACKTAIDEKVIVVVYGKPGVGKSRSLQQYKTEKMTTMPIEIACSANITTRYFAQKIAKELGLDDRPPTAKLEDMIVEKLKKSPRLLFVDQANYLNEKGLGTICYVWEMARTPIVLIGTKDLFNLFMTSQLTEDVRAQLTSRVAWHCPLMELSVEEVKSIVTKMLGARATNEVIKQILDITNGNHRHLDMVLPRIAAIFQKNEAELESGDVAPESLVQLAGKRLMVA